jgi:DNA-binding beta-propeller fold protein YncE
MLIKFSHDGTFILQIGGRDASPTSQDPPVVGGNKAQDSVHQSADAFVYEPTNELYVADGYGNRRVAVFDADTAAFKRAWGAFGNEAIDVLPAARVVGEAGAGGGAGRGRGRGAAPALDTEGPGAPQFGSPVHSVKVSHDGLVYVADRSNRRVQVFQTDGTYVDQLFVNRAGPSGGSVAGIVLSPDADQRFMYLADYGNSHIVVVDRKALQVLYQFGQRSAAQGDFQGLHHLTIDSKGNLYTGEVAPGARAQKFVFKGMSPTRPANALTDEQLLGQPAQ